MTDTALVTGGAGFVGSHLCERLLEEGYKVLCVDNFGSGSKKNLDNFRESSRFSIIEKDIRETSDFPAADEVYHLASRASPEDFTEFPVKIALTNTVGTRNLLEYTVENDAKMLFASTSEVYGDPEVHPQPETYTGNVNIRGVRGCYDEAKRFGETLAVSYRRRYNVDVRTVRIFNTYGPRMRPDDGRVVPTFITQALEGDDITVYGDGTQTRSFCYVDDLIEGIRQVMSVSDLSGDVINLGNDNEISIQKLAETVMKVVNDDSAITYKPLPEDDPTRRKPDLTKADKMLDWEPSISIEDGLRRTADHFTDQI